LLALFPAREYEADDLYAHPEGEKYCPNPDIFRSEKHQHAAKYEQRNGENPFSTGIPDHGLEKLLGNKTIFTIDFARGKKRELNRAADKLSLPAGLNFLSSSRAMTEVSPTAAAFTSWGLYV
jgi:hypothetical protein